MSFQFGGSAQPTTQQMTGLNQAQPQNKGCGFGTPAAPASGAFSFPAASSASSGITPAPALTSPKKKRNSSSTTSAFEFGPSTSLTTVSSPSTTATSAVLDTTTTVYHLAENIDAELQRMTEDIREINEYVNTANKTQDENDLVLISTILKAHKDDLQWINQIIDNMIQLYS